MTGAMVGPTPGGVNSTSVGQPLMQFSDASVELLLLGAQLFELIDGECEFEREHLEIDAVLIAVHRRIRVLLDVLRSVGRSPKPTGERGCGRR